jgi:hypothetical protein
MLDNLHIVTNEKLLKLANVMREMIHEQTVLYQNNPAFARFNPLAFKQMAELEASAKMIQAHMGLPKEDAFQFACDFAHSHTQEYLCEDLVCFIGDNFCEGIE